MSSNEKSLRMGLVVFAVVMAMCSIANCYVIYNRDRGIARLQVRIDALEAKVNTLMRKSVTFTRAE